MSFVCFARVIKSKIRRDSTWIRKNVVYLPDCRKCNKNVVGSCIEWKPRFRTYRSHLKSKYPTCSIVNQFLDECNDPHVSFKYLCFLLIDVLNNVEH